MLGTSQLSGFGSGPAGGRVDMSELHQTNLAFHFRADTGVTVATGVSAWQDQVSGSITLAQGTSGSQPSYNAAETVGSLAGAGAITFDGSNDFLTSTSVKIAGGVPNLIFMVFKPIAWVSGRRVFSGRRADTSDASLYQQGSDTKYDISLGVADVGDVTFATGSWALVSTLWNNDSATYLAINNDSPVTGNAGPVHMDTAFTIAAGGLGANNWGNIAVAELAIYSVNKTSATLTSIKNYFNDQYGLY